MKNKGTNLCSWIVHQWLWSVIALVAFMSTMGSYRAVAQGTATATPDVNTIPPIHLIVTPTPPAQVPVVTATPAPVSQEDSAQTNSEATVDSNIGTDNGESNNRNPADSLQENNGGQVGESSTTPLPIETNGRPESQGSGDGPQLLLAIQPSRAFIWQRQSLRLTMLIENRGNQTAEALHLRSDLPPFLQVIAIHSNSGPLDGQQPNRAIGNLLLLEWPELAPGAAITVTLDLLIAPTTPNGVFIDTFAVVTEQNSQPVVAGISIAMPPALPPRF